MSSTSSTGRPSTARSATRSPPPVALPGLRPTACASPSRPASSPTQGADSSSGPTTTVSRFDGPSRCSAIAGIATEVFGVDAGEHFADVMRAVQVGVDGDDAIDGARNERSDDLLADRPRQDETPCPGACSRDKARPARGLCAPPRRKASAANNSVHQLVVRRVERHIENRRRGGCRPSPSIRRRESDQRR